MNFIQQLRTDLENIGIKDNIDTAILLYLACSTRRMDHKISITLTGQSGVGKSTIAKKVLCLIPDEDKIELSFITKAAFLRLNDLRNKILYIHEHIEDPRLAQPFRLLSSEKNVHYFLSDRNKTKELILKGPAVVIETATNPEKIDFQNRNRNLCIEIALSSDQLKQRFERIKKSKMEVPNTLHESIIARHQEFQKNLDPNIDVVIPYADRIQFKSANAYTQRLLENFFGVLSAIAFLNQNIRCAKRGMFGREHIEATYEDYRLAYELIKSVSIETGTDLLPEESVRLFTDLKSSEKFISPTPFTRLHISRALPYWTPKRVRRHIDKLVENDFLLCKTGIKNRKEYQFTHIGKEISSKEVFSNCFQTLSHPDELQSSTSMTKLGPFARPA